MRARLLTLPASTLIVCTHRCLPLQRSAVRLASSNPQVTHFKFLRFCPAVQRVGFLHRNTSSFSQAKAMAIHNPGSVTVPNKDAGKDLANSNVNVRFAACDNQVPDTRFFIFICGLYAHDIVASLGNEIKLPEGAILLQEGEKQNLTFEENSFQSDVYFQKTLTSQFGTHLLWSPCLPSTHTLLSQNFHVFPLGTVCVADSQVSGKGRTGNIWESPKGCLMLSFTLQMDNGHMLPFLQYVVSIALVDAIEHISLEKGLPILPVKIKWPNDIYANGIKIGGVLCTSTYREKKFNVVVGIGLNVGNRKPTTCLDALLKELVPEAPHYQREELLAAFFVKFEDFFKIFVNEGFVPLESSYYSKWLHSGQEVILEEKQDDNLVEKVSLTIQGLSPKGYLLAMNDHREAYELHPDGNSFDFLKGLVRTKLQA